MTCRVTDMPRLAIMVAERGTEVDKKFTSGDMPLGDLLDRTRDGELQLPDFQRGWVWDDGHLTSLPASVSLSYPIGAVMTLETGNSEVKLKPRPLEGVTLPEGTEPLPPP